MEQPEFCTAPRGVFDNCDRGRCFALGGCGNYNPYGTGEEAVKINLTQPELDLIVSAINTERVRLLALLVATTGPTADAAHADLEAQNALREKLRLVWPS